MQNISNSLNSIYLISRILSAYDELKNTVLDNNEFKNALHFALEKICNGFFIDFNNIDSSCSYLIPNSIITDLPDWFIKKYLKNSEIAIPFVTNAEEAFSLIVSVDEYSRNQAEEFVQSIVYKMLMDANKGDVQFRFLDYKKSGLSFGCLIDLISNQELLGKSIYKASAGVLDIAEELEKTLSENIVSLKGEYNSIFAHNKNNDSKIPITVAVLCDIDENTDTNLNNRIFEVFKNAHIAGISNIRLISKQNENVELSNDENTFLVRFENGKPFVIYNDLELSLSCNVRHISPMEINELEQKLNKVEKIDTTFEHFYNLENYNFFSMESTKKLSIPFAFDENKKVINLEIGGEAPPHALLSGATGSGKSVLLHTLIEQIMLNYHPNDVEIWAIDYKAVEFGCYVSNKTPHIKVIGQDNSEDFSLSLIDLVKKEYDRRKDLFISSDVNSFNAYRYKFGKNSLSRVLIIIDEFHNLTQAIQNYSGEKNYKTILENLLREMRAMGMSFFFCSQTIAAGLNGLTDAARNQIGCRISMKHEDVAEIRETLSLSINPEISMDAVKNLRKGQAIYKKVSTDSTTSFAYELKQVNVLYISDTIRNNLINLVNSELGDNYVKREEIICKNSNRYSFTEKNRHPICKMISEQKTCKNENITIYPGAPTTLEDAFSFTLEDEAGNNLLIIGENDELRESIVLHSILSLLMDKDNRVVVSILDEQNEDSIRIYQFLSKIKSERFLLNFGFKAFEKTVLNLEKMMPAIGYRVTYVWYGLNKLKNLVFLNTQTSESVDESLLVQDIKSEMNPLEGLMMKSIEVSQGGNNAIQQVDGYESIFEKYKNILKKLEEFGPENNRYNITIYNTLKSLKKSAINNIDEYEYRLGCKMSMDDSYDLFGSSSFIGRADDKTVVFYNGSKNGKTIRPYLMPSDNIILQINEIIGENYG